MHLITMAHIGEAKALIEKLGLKKVSSVRYEGESQTCLITGEGPFEAAIQASLELGRKEYTEVFNLGIAGSLQEELEIENIYPVRSLYLAIEGKPQFKSFSSFPQGVDCITSLERILTQEKLSPLQGLGKVVDREAWGVAHAAKLQSVPFKSYKLISDMAGTLGACEIIREKTEEYSEKLALFYLASLNSFPLENQNVFHDLEGFHFTFSTRHQFKSLLSKLALRNEKTTDEILSTLPLEELRGRKILPKERTTLLLECIENKLDPLKAGLNLALQDWKKDFEKKGIHLQTDPSWEIPDVKISFSTSDSQDLEEKLSLLKQLNLKTYLELREGKIHVE